MRVHNGKHIGGRTRPVETPESHPHLFRALAKYMAQPVETPHEFDWAQLSATAQADILGNDRLGDCTAAGRSHLIEAWTANAGAPIVLSTDDTVAFYSLSTGYNPTSPETDRGGDEISVLTAWRDRAAHPIAGWVAVDSNDISHVNSACYLFEGLYLCGFLEGSWCNVNASGFVWDVGAPQNPADGHCIVALGANERGLIVNSWGLLGTMTWAAVQEFCDPAKGGACFALLSADILNRATLKAPVGLDWDALRADVDGLGGAA